MKIGIIGAMDMEVDALKDMMNDAKIEQISSITFYSGKINGCSAVVATAGVGKVNAAVCAQTMILTYKPDAIINIGVAGGLSKELSVGDIAVAKSVVEHDMDTTAVGDEPGLISGLNVVNINCDDKISNAMMKIISRIHSIKAVQGVIASGDQFISSEKGRNRIITQFNAIAAEMEGASIGHVCAMNNVRFGVMRAISDGADTDSVVDYPTFAKMAAKNSVSIAVQLIQELNGQES